MKFGVESKRVVGSPARCGWVQSPDEFTAALTCHALSYGHACVMRKQKQRT
jgi:hypothetical protein